MKEYELLIQDKINKINKLLPKSTMKQLDTIFIIAKSNMMKNYAKMKYAEMLKK